jgi:Alcohol dehydrogenase transcription factor Myb/SANT-like
MLDSYGETFYSTKSIPRRATILKDISNAFSNFGLNYDEKEIERRLKSMRTHFRRKKKNLQKGITPKVEWEYYAKLDAIFTKLEDTEPDNKVNLSLGGRGSPKAIDSEEKISLKRKVEAILADYSDDNDEHET